MPTTEIELVMMLQHILATACRGELRWIKSLQGADIPTTAPGLLLRFRDGSEFQLTVLRTRRSKRRPEQHHGRPLRLIAPEDGSADMPGRGQASA